MRIKDRIGNCRLKDFKKVADTLSELQSGDWSERLTAAFSKSQKFFSSRTKYFQIAICGSFQAGKSTTVNAILGGREISASSTIRGLRTSACNVYFFGSDEEYCRLKFITDEEICAKINQVLRADIPRKELYNWQTREFLWSKIFELLQTENLEERAQVEQIALLISGMGYLISLRRKTKNIPVEEVLKYGKAPEDEIIRWDKIHKSKINQPADLSRLIQSEFPIKEVLYPFITSIDVYVNCVWLRNSNVCLVDVPGLSANQQDTLTAMRALESADALLYLFTGEKELSEYERQFVRQLRNFTANIPVIFAVNQYGQPKPAILDSIQALLKDCDHSGDLTTYNALMACLAAQGQALLENNLDETTANSLKARAKINSIDAETLPEIWSELAADEVKKISKPDSKIVSKSSLSRESINVVQNHSNWEKFLTALDDLHGCQIWQTALSKQIDKPIAAHVDILDREIRAEIDRLKKSFAEAEAIANCQWNERYSALNIHLANKKKNFQFTINENWIKFVCKNMIDSIAAKIPELSFVLTLLCTNYESEFEYDIDEDFGEIFNAAFRDWRKNFLDTQSDSPLKILVERAYEFSADKAKFLLEDISENLNKNPSPLHTNEKMREIFIEPLIYGAYCEALYSKAREDYFSAQNSWNPFINKEKRMKEAQSALYRRICNAFQSKFSELEEAAVQTLSKRPTLQPRQIYALAIQWLESMIVFEENSFHSKRNSELAKIHQRFSGESKLRECQRILKTFLA